MALKSILDIEVNDAAFQKYQATFEKYKAAVEKLPGAWGKVDGAVEGASASLVESVASVLVLNEMLGRSGKGAEDLSRNSSGIARLWRDIAGSTTTAVSNFGRIGGFIRELGIGAAIGGLLGAGGVYGLDRLGLGAGSLRRTVTGLGTNAGNYQAFGVDFNRYLDANSLVQNVQEARSDWGRKWAFGAMGINPSGMDSTDLAASVADRARSQFMNSDRSAQFAQAHGLSQFFSIEDLNRMANTSDSEWGKARDQYTADRSRVGNSDDTLRKWQDFTRQLDLAGTQIKTTLIDGLVPLTPALIRLSGSLADAIQRLMANPNVGKFIDEMGAAAERFAGWANKWMDKLGVPSGADAGGGGYGPQLPSKALLSASHGNPPGMLFADYGISSDSNLMRIIAQVESSEDPMKVSSAGAQGLMQLMPGTSKQYGVKDPFNASQSLAGARKYFAHLSSIYGGDTEKSLAAYNWGEGNLSQDIFKYGQDWRAHLPKETTDYLSKIESKLEAQGATMYGAGGTVKIVVENRTGSDVNVSQSQNAGG